MAVGGCLSVPPFKPRLPLCLQPHLGDDEEEDFDDDDVVEDDNDDDDVADYHCASNHIFAPS